MILMDSEMAGHEIRRWSMNGGDGPQSYNNNCSYQRGALDGAKPIIEEEIAKNLDIEHIESTVWIADFGCSTGSNSFPAMQIIIDAIKKMKKKKCTNLIPHKPDYCVLFNDVVTNDFNTLFSSLPAQRDYHAIGVPGDFHGRLLPPSSLHIAYSCFSLHWLTKSPNVWNEGRIWYCEDRKEVCDAYFEQFGKDMEAFLEARAVEIVGGGLMALIFPGLPASKNSEIEYTMHSETDLLGSCLIDMSKKGMISKAKIDSFNIPYYFPTPVELKAILQRNKAFTIQRMEITNNLSNYSLQSVKARTTTYRAIHESLITNHFGAEIIDELFHLYEKKLAASRISLNPNNDVAIMILVVLKRVMN